MVSKIYDFIIQLRYIILRYLSHMKEAHLNCIFHSLISVVIESFIKI